MVTENNMDEAHKYANNARNFMIASVVIGIIWIALVVILRVVVYSTASAYSY